MKKVILIALGCFALVSCKKKFNYECTYFDSRTREYSEPFYPGKMTTDDAALYQKANTYTYSGIGGKTYTMICQCHIKY